MEKRGLSGVVTAVILIAISIALISIVWVIISNIVDNGLNTTEKDLTKIELNILDGSEKNSSITEFSLKINRGYDENKLIKMDFLFQSEEESYRITLINDLEAGEGKTYEFNTNEFSGINNITELTEVSIIPIIELGSQEETLTVADTHKFNF